MTSILGGVFWGILGSGKSGVGWGKDGEARGEGFSEQEDGKHWRRRPTIHNTQDSGVFIALLNATIWI